jgi:hypothetical protein
MAADFALGDIDSELDAASIYSTTIVKLMIVSKIH